MGQMLQSIEDHRIDQDVKESTLGVLD